MSAGPLGASLSPCYGRDPSPSTRTIYHSLFFSGFGERELRLEFGVAGGEHYFRYRDISKVETIHKVDICVARVMVPPSFTIY